MDDAGKHWNQWMEVWESPSCMKLVRIFQHELKQGHLVMPVPQPMGYEANFMQIK